jgi:hypothetical protein
MFLRKVANRHKLVVPSLIADVRTGPTRAQDDEVLSKALLAQPEEAPDETPEDEPVGTGGR